MATVQEFAYAGGLFDGEGTIDMKDKVRMAVKMTDVEPVMHIYEALGGHFYQWKDQESGRPTYEWRAAGWDGVMYAIDNIYPHVHGKRRQLEVVANWHDYKEKWGPLPEAKRAASVQLRGLRVPNPIHTTFDIETMGLDRNTLNMLSCSYQFGTDESSRFGHIRPQKQEHELVVLVRDELEAAPWTVGFNSKRFDIPWIQTRLSMYGERPMFLGSHDDAEDIYDDWQGNTKRTSLHNAAKKLGLIDANEYKTPIDWDLWNDANMGGDEGTAYVLDHAKKDIALTDRVYQASRWYGRTYQNGS